MAKSLHVLVTELCILLHRWQKVVSYLSAGVMKPADLDSCIDHEEVWRGALLIREEKVGTLVCDGETHNNPCAERTVLCPLSGLTK